MKCCRSHCGRVCSSAVTGIRTNLVPRRPCECTEIPGLRARRATRGNAPRARRPPPSSDQHDPPGAPTGPSRRWIRPLLRELTGNRTSECVVASSADRPPAQAGTPRPACPDPRRPARLGHPAAEGCRCRQRGRRTGGRARRRLPLTGPAVRRRPGSPPRPDPHAPPTRRTRRSRSGLPARGEQLRPAGARAPPRWGLRTGDALGTHDVEVHLVRRGSQWSVLVAQRARVGCAHPDRGPVFAVRVGHAVQGGHQVVDVLHGHHRGLGRNREVPHGRPVRGDRLDVVAAAELLVRGEPRGVDPTQAVPREHHGVPGRMPASCSACTAMRWACGSSVRESAGTRSCPGRCL